jgi:hypothetical protein
MTLIDELEHEQKLIAKNKARLKVLNVAIRVKYNFYMQHTKLRRRLKAKAYGNPILKSFLINLDNALRLRLELFRVRFSSFAKRHSRKPWLSVPCKSVMGFGWK